MDEYVTQHSKFKFESLRTNKRNGHLQGVISSDVSTYNYLMWLQMLC